MAIDDDDARALLADERTRLEAALAAAEDDLAEERFGADEELAAYDQHPAEAGTEVEDMLRDLGLRGEFHNLLRENEAAVRRLEQGSYGVCERCGRRINEDRLRAVPSTRYCLEHATLQAS